MRVGLKKRAEMKPSDGPVSQSLRLLDRVMVVVVTTNDLLVSFCILLCLLLFSSYSVRLIPFVLLLVSFVFVGASPFSLPRVARLVGARPFRRLLVLLVLY